MTPATISSSLTPSYQPRLARRASLVVCAALCLVGGAGALGTYIGATEEALRRQREATADYASALAGETFDWLSSGAFDGVADAAARAGAQQGVLVAQVYDRDMNLLSDGGAGAARDALHAVVAHALRDNRAAALSTPGGLVVSAAPIAVQGEEASGAVVVVTTRAAFTPDWAALFGPFLILLTAAVVFAASVWHVLARRALAPVGALTAYAKRVAEGEREQAAPVRRGDEFEALSLAMSAMVRKLQSKVQKLQALAYVDPESGLPNEPRFLGETEIGILRNAAEQRNLAVLVIEMRRLGEQVGLLESASRCELMQSVGRFIAHAARDIAAQSGSEAGASVALARTGALEFSMCLMQCASAGDAVRFAQSLNAKLGEGLWWRNQLMQLGPACGVALAPRDGKSADAVLRKARLALQVSHNAPAKLQVFSQSLDHEAAAKLALERELREAIESSAIRAYFQPKIDLQSGRIVGAEALARWVKPNTSVVSPGKFIPIAEESGLIAPLSEAVLRESCWKAAAWARAGMKAVVSVNVSPLQLRDEHFADRVSRIIKHAGLPGPLLELEITESTAMADPERVARILAPLRRLGVKLAIDDFGCGHSSLSALAVLPFDTIKIDRQFVSALERNEPKAEAILESILAMAGALKLETVAEGIERREQAEFLAHRGCNLGQGFYYGGALPAGEFMNLLAQRKMCESGVAVA